MIRKPIDRYDLKIKKSDYVVEFGPGHNPNYRSNVLVEKFIDSNYHRSSDIRMFPHQQYYHEDGTCTTFKDKEFDYSICIQMIEHVDNPEAFLKEQMRIAKGGYLESPSIIGELLFPKQSHKWVILEIDNKLVFFEKAKITNRYNSNCGSLFLNYLPYLSLPYRMLKITEGDLFTNRYEWRDSIDFIVEPQDEYYRAFIEKEWDMDMIQKLFPKHSVIKELSNCIRALAHILKTKLTPKRTPVLVSKDKIQTVHIGE